MHKQYRSIVLASLVTVFGLAAIIPAFAGATGRKNTAMVLTGATVYSFLKGNDKAAIVGTLASAQAWKGYEDARKREARQREYYSYNRGNYYGKNKSNGYNKKYSQKSACTHSKRCR